MKNEKLVKEHGDNHHYQQDRKLTGRVFLNRSEIIQYCRIEVQN